MKFQTANAGKSRFAGGTSVSPVDLASSDSIKESLDEMRAVSRTAPGTARFRHFILRDPEQTARTDLIMKLAQPGSYVVVEIKSGKGRGSKR